MCSHSERKTLKVVSSKHPPNQRELLIIREKSLQSLLIPSLIVIPIERRFLSKHYPHLFRVLSFFGALGSIGRCQDGRCYGLQRNPVSQKRKRFGVISLEQEAWRAQVYWVDQAQRVYYCSCIPTTFSSGLLTTWRATERFYAEGFGFLFDNTSCVVLVFASLFPLSLSFIFCCGCVFNWLRLFTYSVYSFCSFSAHQLFDIKLELIILLLGV